MKHLLRQCFIGGTEPASIAADVGLTITRIAAGFILAFGHGIGKIPPAEDFIEAVGNLGFPMPMIFAWLAGISEFFGGILLALGLFTRPAAFLIAGTMFVAAFVVHWSDPLFMAGAEPGQGSKEMAVLYLIIAIAFLLAGSGRISIDRSLRS